MNQPANSAPAHQPQMDGLRALAVIAVLIHHLQGPFSDLLSFGTLGVRYFFVTSGFLITRNLLKSRARCEIGRASWWSELGNFQMRRLIRTLPTYYLFLAVALLLGIPPVRETLFWTLTFLTNFYIASLNYFPQTISHFWSLAVQEQFYFFWPFLVFLLPAKWLRPTMIGFAVVAVVFRFYCIESGTSEIVRWFSLLGNLDSFAVGGLLAEYSIKKPTLISQSRTRLWTGGVVLGCFMVAHRLRLLPLENPLTIWIEPLEVIGMGWLVACSVQGFRGLPGKILSWRPLTYVGKVSYGIYIYHVLVAILLLPILQRHFPGSSFAAQALRFFTEVGVTLLVSSLSWHFLEQPLLKLREPVGRWFSSKAEKRKAAEVA